MSTETEPDNTSSRRGWWAIVALVGAAAIAFLIYLIARPDDTTTTDSDPAGNSASEMDTPSDDMTDDDMHDGSGEADDDTADEDMDDDASDDNGDDAGAASGVYRDYDSAALDEDGYERNILFFHAEWCPECRAFEQELTSTDIPNGVQFLKVDYDTEEDLKNQYGVNLQTTFVEVDDDGEMISSWVGYEKDRSIETIFAGLDDG